MVSRREVLVVQPQKIDAVIVTVRRAHDDMDVEFRGRVIGQEHAGIVVEFDKRHRALYAVIERVVFRGAADPAEMGIGEVVLDVFHARGARPVGQGNEIGIHQV